MHVPEGKDKPYRCSSGFYLRQGTNSQKLARDEILEFGIEEGKIRFDDQSLEDFVFPRDFDQKKFDQYLERAEITTKLSTEEVLKSLNVAVEEDKKVNFNNAGVLFFAENPSDFLSNNLITCVRFNGKTKTSGIIDRKDFENGFLRNVEAALEFVKRNTRTAAKIIEFERVEKEEYPYEAVREGVLNAVMHRDYLIKNAPVHVNIYDDRIEIISPGSLPKGVTLENLGEVSVPRNEVFADLVLRTGLIDKLGTGIKRMKVMMKEYGLEKPEFEEIDDLFKVTFFGPGEDILEMISDERGQDLREEGLNERQIRVLERMVNEGEEMTNKKYRELFDISKKTANRDLNGLLEKNFIERHGSGRSVYYSAR